VKPMNNSKIGDDIGLLLMRPILFHQNNRRVKLYFTKSCIRGRVILERRDKTTYSSYF